jgi:hypothetical protein
MSIIKFPDCILYQKMTIFIKGQSLSERKQKQHEPNAAEEAHFTGSDL